jgi:hypothetical protein
MSQHWTVLSYRALEITQIKIAFTKKRKIQIQDFLATFWDTLSSLLLSGTVEIKM